MSIQTNERDTKTVSNPALVRVTPKMYAEKINRTLRRVQQQCKKVESDPKATIDGFKIEKLGGRYLICLYIHEWENLTPKVTYGDYPFDYDTWLEKLRVRRRAVTAERKAQIKAEKERIEQMKQAGERAVENAWNRFCCRPMAESWAKYREREVSDFMADFMRDMTLIEIPRSKMRSQFYAPRFHTDPELGEFLMLESDQEFLWHNMRATMTIAVSLLCNHFWIWEGALVYFEGFNPDGTPRNPRLCAFERQKQKQAAEDKFAPIQESN